MGIAVYRIGVVDDFRKPEKSAIPIIPRRVIVSRVECSILDTFDDFRCREFLFGKRQMLNAGELGKVPLHYPDAAPTGISEWREWQQVGRKLLQGLRDIEVVVSRVFTSASIKQQ